MNEIIDLSEFDDAYEEAVVEERSYVSIPDGKYQVEIVQAELKETKNTGNPMLSLTMSIIAGQHKSRLMFKNSVLSSPSSVKWLKQDLLTCGLNLSKLSDLPNRLDDMIGVTLEVTKRTKGENENIYLNKKIKTEAEDDLPF